MPRLITSTPAVRCSATLRSSCANAYGGMSSRRLLGFMQLPCELVAEPPAEDGSRPARELDVQILLHLDLELAAVEHHRHVRLARGAAVIRDEGHRRAAGARPRGEGLPHPALEDARADPPAVLGLAGAELGVPGDVRAVRELSVELDLGPDGGEVERRELLDG